VLRAQVFAQDFSQEFTLVARQVRMKQESEEKTKALMKKERLQEGLKMQELQKALRLHPELFKNTIEFSGAGKRGKKGVVTPKGNHKEAARHQEATKKGHQEEQKKDNHKSKRGSDGLATLFEPEPQAEEQDDEAYPAMEEAQAYPAMEEAQDDEQQGEDDSPQEDLQEAVASLSATEYGSLKERIAAREAQKSGARRLLVRA
jgi:hypothetical protein